MYCISVVYLDQVADMTLACVGLGYIRYIFMCAFY